MSKNGKKKHNGGVRIDPNCEMQQLRDKAVQYGKQRLMMSEEDEFNELWNAGNSAYNQDGW